MERTGLPKTKWQRILNWKLLLVLAAGTIGLVALESSHGDARSAGGPVNLITVAVAKVARQDLSEEQTFEAEFRPYQEIDLHAKVAGFVQKITVDIGDHVQQGEVLAVLEIPELKEDLERAQAMELRNEKEVEQARAKYDDALTNYTRLLSVNQTRPNLIAQQDLDTAQSRDRAAEAEWESARQQVQVSMAEVDKLKAMLNYCKITAPFSGVITRRYADEGSLVQGGVTANATATPLVRLSQNDRLRLDFPVSVSYVSRIKVGDPVEIRIQALGKTISGKISRFTQKVDAATRKMESEVDVPNADFSITPGIYAVAALELEHRKNVLTIPTEAILNHRAPTVYVLGKENEVEERPVILGLETADRLEVVSGIRENEFVMIGSRAQVKPGQKVGPKLVETTTVQIGSVP